MNRRGFLRLSAGSLAALPLLKHPMASAQQTSPIAQAERRFIVAFAPNGYSYGRDSLHDLVCRDAAGSVRWRINTLGTALGELNCVSDISYNTTDASIYVVDRGNCRIQVFNLDGQPLRQWGGPGEEDGKFEFPYGIAIDDGGQVFVTDSMNHRVQVFASDGTFIRTFGELEQSGDGLNGPRGIALHPDGSIHVVDSANQRIQMYQKSGAYIGAYGSAGTDVGQFLFPSDIAITADGTRYIADSTSDFVTVFSPDGSTSLFQPKFGDGRLAKPRWLALRPDGSLYITGLPATAESFTYAPAIPNFAQFFS